MYKGTQVHIFQDMSPEILQFILPAGLAITVDGIRPSTPLKQRKTFTIRGPLSIMQVGQHTNHIFKMLQTAAHPSGLTSRHLDIQTGRKIEELCGNKYLDFICFIGIFGSVWFHCQRCYFPSVRLLLSRICISY